jgi:hypothetical protein
MTTVGNYIDENKPDWLNDDEDCVTRSLDGTCAIGCLADFAYTCGPMCGSAACCCIKTGIGATAATSMYKYAKQKGPKFINDKIPIYDPHGESVVIDKSKSIDQNIRIDKNYILNYIREKLVFPVNNDDNLIKMFEGVVPIYHYNEPKYIFDRIDKSDIDDKINKLNAKKIDGGKRKYSKKRKTCKRRKSCKRRK